MDGFSGEILTKSANHSRNKSDTLDSIPNSPSSSPTDKSPAFAVQKWFSNILKPPPNSPTQPSSDPPLSPTPTSDQTAITLPPRQSTLRKSRFQTESPSPQPQGIPVPSRRTFKSPPAPLTENIQLLSPPKNLIQSNQRRSISSSTCSLPEKQTLSPPRTLMESAHRRSISKSTCSVEKIAPKSNVNGVLVKEENGTPEKISINRFLKEQRVKIEKISNREVNTKAKIVLSGPSNS